MKQSIARALRRLADRSDAYFATEPHVCTAYDEGAWISLRPRSAAGSTWHCLDCGRYWIKDLHDGCAPPSWDWRPVRWWNFNTRRRCH